MNEDNLEISEDIVVSDEIVSDETSTTDILLQEILEVLSEEPTEESEESDLSTQEPTLSDEDDSFIVGSSDNPCYVDFNELIEYLDSKNYCTSEDISILIETQNKSLFDKELNEFSTSESLLCLIVIGGLFILLRSIAERVFRWK